MPQQDLILERGTTQRPIQSSRSPAPVAGLTNAFGNGAAHGLNGMNFYGSTGGHRPGNLTTEGERLVFCLGLEGLGRLFWHGVF
jgi:hypothetical protein